MTTTTISNLNGTKEQNHSFTVFPENLNYAGTLFGGKLLAEIDTATSNAARRMLYHTDSDNLVTAKGEIDFKTPGKLGDIIEINCHVADIGRTSITIVANVMKEARTGKRGVLCTATFVFVALKDGQPFPHNLSSN